MSLRHVLSVYERQGESLDWLEVVADETRSPRTANTVLLLSSGGIIPDPFLRFLFFRLK